MFRLRASTEDEELWQGLCERAQQHRILGNWAQDMRSVGWRQETIIREIKKKLTATAVADFCIPEKRSSMLAVLQDIGGVALVLTCTTLG